MTLSILPFPPYLFTRCLLFLPPLHRLSSPVMEVHLSPADEFMSNGCGSIFWDACSKQEAQRGCRGEQREGLSGQAGLPSITMPIETAAQSSVLHSQIRPPDRAALQSDPTHHNGWDRTRDSTWPTTLKHPPSPITFRQILLDLFLKKCRDAHYFLITWC